MDYPFYIKSVAEIPPEIINNLAEIAMRQQYVSHPHFYKTQPVRAYMGSKDYSCELGQYVKSRLVPLIPMNPDTITMWEVNLLPSQSSIAEHSDIASQNGAQGSLVARSHKIHIPLVTNSDCVFTHRRTKQLEPSVQTMPAGVAYAYNNYVWHAVHNKGSEDRYQMTLRYWDPDWSDRAKLLTHLGIHYFDGYELI